jgi:hypothetical protein
LSLFDAQSGIAIQTANRNVENRESGAHG